ncbi:SBDS family rRNA metabolism protein [[Candida] zeylanoides]
MPINQPSSQIKLTNVSLVRMKKGKKRFEVACYQNKVQDYRSGVEKDLDEVLQIPQVFVNVSKGQVASNEDLLTAFGSTEVDAIIQEILLKGEIQLNEKERQANIQQKTNEFLTIVSTKCINPRSKKRYPPSMIQKALAELKFHLNPTRPTKQQALDAIKLLVARQLFPIARAQMKIRFTVASKQRKTLYDDKVKALIDTVEDETAGKVFECVGVIDPYNYREIAEVVEKSRGDASVEVLEMAAVKED